MINLIVHKVSSVASRSGEENQWPNAMNLNVNVSVIE